MIHEFVRTHITAEPFKNPVVRRIIDDEIRYQNQKRRRVIDICDPFARESWTTTKPQGMNIITNDLNEKMPTEFHMEANDFAEHMCNWERRFDLILFDPPYNLSQLKKQYDGIGKDLEHWQTLNPFTRCKAALARCLRPGGSIISFGFGSRGFGEHRGLSKVALYNLEPTGNEYRYNVQVVVERKLQHNLMDIESE